MLTLCVVVLAVAAASAEVDYSGHQVYRITPTKDAHVEWLNKLVSQEHIEVWKELKGLNHPVDVMVHPTKLNLLNKALNDFRIDYQITVDDVQGLINAAKPSKTRTRPLSNFTDYMDYATIEVWLTDAVAACGSRCTLINIGQTYEGRNMWVVKMSTGPGKRGVWVDGGIHAREWIAVSTALFITDRLVYDYDIDPDVNSILATRDVYILPVVNPDGYSYSWTDERLWRRTRNPHDEDNNNPCVGADANRNYDFMWMTVGASDNPCDDTFAGPYAHSEPETVNQRDYMFTLTGTLDVFLTLHTYGQLWMAPWGYTEDDPATYDELMRVANIGADALTAVHGTVYTRGSAADILYESSGTSRDWAYGHAQTQIPYVYTLELRNENSFVLPPSEILPTGEETWAGFKAMVFAINPASPKN